MINTPNLKLRKSVKTGIINLETGASIARKNKVSKQRVHQLIKKLFTPEEIKELKFKRHELTMKKYES